MRNLSTFFAVVLAFGMGGCGDDSGGDDGGITIMDDGGGGGDDDGGGGGGGGSCEPVRFDPPAGDACDAETMTCIGMAMSQDDLVACIEADSSPMECGNCLDADLLSCATNEGGCEEEAGCFNDCIEENMCMDSMCVSNNCGSEQDDFFGCVGESGCMLTAVCFRDGGGGGDTDGGMDDEDAGMGEEDAGVDGGSGGSFLPDFVDLERASELLRQSIDWSALRR